MFTSRQQTAGALAPSLDSSFDLHARRAGWIDAAKRQTHFYDGLPMSVAAFRHSPAFEGARKELFQTYEWLKSLVPSEPRWEGLLEQIDALKQKHTRPSLEIDDEQALMLGAGKRLLQTVCRELERESQPTVCRAAWSNLGETWHPGRIRATSPITALGTVLTTLRESRRSDLVNQQVRCAYRAALEAWCQRELPAAVEVFGARNCAEGLAEYFGVIDVADVMVDTMLDASTLGAEKLNAAFKASGILEASVDPRASSTGRGATSAPRAVSNAPASLTAAPGTTLQRWAESSRIITERMTAQVDKLRQLSVRAGLSGEEALTAFSQRFVGQPPTGGQDDYVGNMQCFGLDVMTQLCERMDKLPPKQLREVLSELLRELKGDPNPAAVFLRTACHDVPDLEFSAEELELRNRAMGGVVHAAVRESARTALPPGGERAERARMVSDEFKYVCKQLGVTYVEAERERVTESGLFDKTSDSLAALLAKAMLAATEATRAARAARATK